MTARLYLPVTDRKMLLNANDRLHWRVRSDRTSYWRTRAGAAARANRVTFDGKVRVVGTFTVPDNRTRDANNWQPTLKACVDGLTDAGWWADDDSSRVEGPDARIADERGPWSLRIEVFPA